MVRSSLTALAVLLVLAATAVATSPAALAQAGADGLGFRAGAGGPEGGGGGLKRWADQYLDFFSGEGRTDQRRPSCRGRECPSGTQCCCCGDRCYCKEECSFQPCADVGGR
jgi:hypothetical protein